MHNFTSIPIFYGSRIFLSKFNAVKLATGQDQAQHETMVCIIIDKIFFVGPELFAQDDWRMQ